MLLPNAENAFVDIRKLSDYCLNSSHEIGKHKAQVFASALDLMIKDAEESKEALLSAVKTEEAVVGRLDKFGQRYTVDFIVDFIIKQEQKKATVRSGWIIETDVNIPRLTTCFVL